MADPVGTDFVTDWFVTEHVGGLLTSATLHKLQLWDFFFELFFIVFFLLKCHNVKVKTIWSQGT